MTKAVIIDANVFSKSMRHEIEYAIANHGLKVIVSKGGKLEQELKNACLEKYAELGRSDRLHIVCGRSVEKKQKSINDNANIQSNDSHIVALAIVACANTLFTNEKDNLIRDFKDVCRINREANCIEDNRLESRGGQKVIRQGSPRPRAAREIINNAKSKGHCCKCLLNCGSCQGSGCQPE